MSDDVPKIFLPVQEHPETAELIALAVREHCDVPLQFEIMRELLRDDGNFCDILNTELAALCQGEASRRVDSSAVAAAMVRALRRKQAGLS